MASRGEYRSPDSTKRPFRPILRVDMHRKNLLTQVLFANLLLIVVAVIATGVAGNPNLNLGERPELALILALVVGLTIIVNVFMLQRRFRPLERLVDEMERADLARPGAGLPSPGDGHGGPEEGARLQRALRALPRPPGAGAPTPRERAPGRAGGGARARRTRPPRR